MREGEVMQSSLSSSPVDEVSSMECTLAHLAMRITYAICDGAAAMARRKSVAIPDDELARLSLDGDLSSEVSSEGALPEAAKLFWAGEELTDMGRVFE